MTLLNSGYTISHMPKQIASSVSNRVGSYLLPARVFFFFFFEAAFSEEFDLSVKVLI